MDPARRVLIGGCVGIAGDRVVAVEPSPDQVPAARRRIDATGKIVLPGLVDSHGHAGHSLTRGLGEGREEGGWSAIVEEIYFRASDDEFWRAESRLAALERLKFGVTTSLSMTGSSPRVDDARYAVAAAVGYRELGLRHVVAAGPPNGPWPRHYVDRTDPAAPRPLTVDLDHALRVTEECAAAILALGEDRVSFSVGPSAVSPAADAPDDLARRQIAGVKRILERHNTGLHTHAYRGMIRVAHGLDPELLGPHACLAHCAGIEPDEVAILARTGASASSGPLTHAYALDRFPLVEALDAGVNVAFSTDGSAPDRSFDLLDQARVGVQLQRAHFRDTALLPAGKVLAMITIDAARALNLHRDVGSLEPGKKADVVLLDWRQAHLAPAILPSLRVVGHASGHDVVTVIVDGRVLMEDRVVLGVDEAAILRDAETAFAETFARAGFADPNALHPDTWHAVRYGAG
jgi:cytosine/adenosine deaminase-related metal-dependent hydrolase